MILSLYVNDIKMDVFFLFRTSVFGIRGQTEGPDPASASKAAGGWCTLSGVWSNWQTPTTISMVQKWGANHKSQQEEVHCKRITFVLLYYIVLYFITETILLSK